MEHMILADAIAGLEKMGSVEMIIMLLSGAWLTLYCLFFRQSSRLRFIAQQLDDIIATDETIKCRENESSYYVSRIAATDGNDWILIDVNDIAMIYLVEGNRLLRTFDNRDYLMEWSIDQAESKLDPEQFFRINRQLIANRKACKVVRDATFGKIEVAFRLVSPVKTIVSQRKAQLFKQWIGKDLV